MKQKKMLALYLTGKYTHAEVAKKVGTSYNNVTNFYWRIKQKFELPKTKRQKGTGVHKIDTGGIPKKKVAEAYALYTSGLTLEQVGKKYGGVSRERVRQIFKA